jgi:hypothetical protein
MIQFAPQPSGERYTTEKAAVDRQLPAGRFAAVEGDVIIAEADTHRQLVALFAEQGRSPKDLVILQAGIDYPATATIF